MAEAEALANIRRRVCGVMNKTRKDFSTTPPYDDFLENREDLISRFLALQKIDSIEEAASLRDALNKEFSRYEQANESQILASRANEDERKREKAREIVKAEGLFYQRVNADYSAKDKALTHPLQAQIIVPELPVVKGVIEKRRTRLMPTNASSQNLAESIASTLEAAGVAGIWKIKALQSIRNAYLDNLML